MSLEQLIKKIEQKQNFTLEEAEQFLTEIIAAETKEELVERAILAYADKPPTAQEVIGFLKVMRTKSLHINVEPETVDNCGTGGSGMLRINTSTMAALIAAAAGIKIAKHGNKASSGRCGSFDILEAAGINIQITPEQAQKTYNDLGLVFLYAPLFHPAMARVAQVRKKIGKPTIFNILGPLCNPANVTRQVIGVSNVEHVPVILEALKYFAAEHVMIVRGDYGLDEITVTGASQIWELKNGEVKEYQIHPRDFGIEPCKMAYIKGGDTEYNRRVFFSVLENKDREYRTEQVLFNAAAAIYVSGKAKDIFKAYQLAKEVLTSKQAYQKFIEYRNYSNAL